MKTKQELAELLSKEATTLAAQQGKDYDWSLGGTSLNDFYSQLRIKVSDTSAWYSTDDDGRNYRLMDAGKERATVYGRGEGSSVPIAKAMHEQNYKAYNGENTKLTWQDYADIIWKFWSAVSKKKDELEEKEKKQPAQKKSPEQEKSPAQVVSVKVPDKYAITVLPNGGYAIVLYVKPDASWLSRDDQASKEYVLTSKGKKLAQVAFKPSESVKTFVQKIHEISNKELGGKLTATPADHEKAMKILIDALKKVRKK